VDGVMLPEQRVEAAVVREAPRRAQKKAVVTERRVRIVLEENEGIPPSGQFFGINGVGYMLKPGMEADVPLAIVDILNNAIISKPIVDPDTKQVTGFKPRLRFPYRVVQVIEPDRQAA
jgi:hypothetical protein